MPENNTPVRRIEISGNLSGRETLKLLLQAAGFPSVADWARHREIYRTAAHLMLSGDREYPEYRDMLAEDVGKPRHVIDQLIDGAKNGKEHANA